MANKTKSGREALNCYWCKSTARERAVLLQIHKQYIKRKATHPFRALNILGVSDGHLTSTILGSIYRDRYINYHYHLEPKLDITDVPNRLYRTADIISCSEVLEHVEPPIEKAFGGLFQLLKRNGTLVLSVPHTDLLGEHIEHFPIMKASQISMREEGPVLEGTSIQGEQMKFTKLIFHGGIGATLEYRVFSENSLIEHLHSAGFARCYKNINSRIFGICWEPWSRVWVGKK